MLTVAALLVPLLTAGCERPGVRESTSNRAADAPARQDDRPRADTAVMADAGRFLPAALSSSDALWGTMRGRLARLQLTDGVVDATRHTAWSVSAAPAVVSWRNDLGTWVMRDGEGARRLAATELVPGYDGPPEVLWSPGGNRAVLSWTAEWDLHHALLAGGGITALATAIPGYMLDRAVLWLDSTRVLFQVVGNGPRGGEPEYRESGWRSDLAVLDLSPAAGTGDDPTTFRQVTEVSDGSFLHAAGLLGERLLVTEWVAGRVAAHWLYDITDWNRAAFPLPPGRAWAAGSTIVSYEPGAAGEARLHARLFAAPASAGTQPQELADLGIAADPDLPPALSRDGRLVALRILADGKPQLVVARIQP